MWDRCPHRSFPFSPSTSKPFGSWPAARTFCLAAAIHDFPFPHSLPRPAVLSAVGTIENSPELQFWVQALPMMASPAGTPEFLVVWRTFRPFCRPYGTRRFGLLRIPGLKPRGCFPTCLRHFKAQETMSSRLGGLPGISPSVYVRVGPCLSVCSEGQTPVSGVFTFTHPKKSQRKRPEEAKAFRAPFLPRFLAKAHEPACCR